MKKNLSTKAAKGIAFGDVSNTSVRNILTEISKRISGCFTEQEMYDTLEFFGWRCPYTGKDLKPLIENNLGGYATDHICPQNKEWCGLNVKGNIVIVDSCANGRKRGLDVETFLLNDTKVITNIDEIGRTRQERLDKIREFQTLCGYDPEKIRQEIGGLLARYYDEQRKVQEQRINESIEKLENLKIYAISTVATSSEVTSVKATKNVETELIFYPSDEKEFKRRLLQIKKARFILVYDTGVKKESKWDAKSFEKSSNVRGNIQSRPFWRNRKKEGLIRVEVILDGNERDESDELYIRYEKGWQSFRPKDEYVTGYCIEGDTITFSKNMGFSFVGETIREIAPNDMKELIAILDEAKTFNLFENSNTAIRTIHGVSCTYNYYYLGASGNNCLGLFIDDSRTDALWKRYNTLIDKLTK